MRVRQEVRISQLLRGDLDDAITVIRQSRALLETWKAEYFNMRSHLEESECNRRFVFSNAYRLQVCVKFSLKSREVALQARIHIRVSWSLTGSSSAATLAAAQDERVIGFGRRWEFDRRKLFRRTDYMATVCSKFEEIANTIGQFKRFIGPKLRSVTRSRRAMNRLTSKIQVCLAYAAPHLSHAELAIRP